MRGFSDERGISLSLQRGGSDDIRKTVHMHFHYGLFAEILRELARTANFGSTADKLRCRVLRRRSV
jgi:hypothetical protein